MPMKTPVTRPKTTGIQMVVLVLVCGVFFSASPAFSQAVVKWSGRMTLTSDGNAHDRGNIDGAAMMIALVYSAGLKDRFVHLAGAIRLDQIDD